MKMYKLIILSILIFVLQTSCKPNYGKIFKENNDYFELHRVTLNKTIKDIEIKHLSHWSGQDFFVPMDSLNEQTKKTLMDLGVGSIEITRNTTDNCEKNYCVILNVTNDWNVGTLRVVQLVFAPCNENAEINHHYFDGYHRHFWGQGDN
jgi:hypothetical protein